MAQESTKRMTIRLSQSEYEQLCRRGQPASVATQLVRECLSGDGTGKRVSGEGESVSSRLGQDIRNLELAIRDLESTASFRHLTREEVFSLSKTAAQYKEEISATNQKTARFMKSFLERISSSLEAAERIEKEVSRIEGIAGKYGQVLSGIDRTAELSLERSKQFKESLFEIDQRLSQRVEAVIKSCGEKAIDQGRKMFFWGSAFVVFGTLFLFFLHYFGVFYPDPEWLRGALLGRKGGG